MPMAWPRWCCRSRASPSPSAAPWVEALSVGVPVAGYAHGGVGELLRELLPAGAVALGDVDALAAVVANWLRHPPEVPSPARYRLAQMQEATLALYTEIVEAWPD